MEKRIYNLFFLFCLVLSGISPLKTTRVELGNELFLKEFPRELQKKRLGLLINQTSILPGGKSLVEALLREGHDIQAIFTPEHGLSGTIEAGFEVEDSQYKSIPIYSLYGKVSRPTPEQIENVDALIYDIQDVGTRFYTYISTLKYVLEAAAEARIPVYVLDRPNPLGGEIIEGPLLKRNLESYFGALPIPIRYGLTPGELAMMMKREGWVPENVNLHVTKMKNWKRNSYWKETGLPWIPPSPNMPTAETAIVYPGTGLLEAININEGRGTSSPFLQFGAPWFNPEPIIKILKDANEFPVEFESVKFVPLSLPGKALAPLYQSQTCLGIRVHVSQEEKFYSLRFGLALIKAVKKYHSQRFLPNSQRLNLMFGNELLDSFLKGKITFPHLMAQMEEEENFFKEKRQKYLLYE